MLAILNARLLTCGPLGDIEGGSLLLEHGKILAAGCNLAIPSDATQIDAQGMTVTPGFIDAHTHMGISWQELDGGSDTNEGTGINNAHLTALDSIDFKDVAFQDAVDTGVTTAAILAGKLLIGSPSISPIAGQGVVMKMRGDVRGHEILRHPAGVTIAMGADVAAFLHKRGIGPNSPMGISAFLRSALDAAGRYAKRPPGNGDVDLRMEILSRLLANEFQAYINVHRASDILAALRIIEEYKLDAVLHHVTEGHLIVEELADRQIPCVLGPTSVAREALPELRNASRAAPGQLAAAGVPVALMTDHPTDPIQFLPVIAGEAIREGMSYQDALHSITINPARILGVDDRVGSIEPGKDADIVIHDGDPLETMTRVKAVIADGELVIDKLSHQTQRVGEANR